MTRDFNENKFPIYTNNLEIKINRENVDKSFIIFQIGTNNLFFHENVLDISSEKYKAQSVAYYQKTRLFAMFKKGSVSFDKLKSEIQKIDESAIINMVDLFDSDENSKTNIKDVELAQLLVNSLKNRDSELFSYNNLTGNLYYSFNVTENAKSFELLKLRFYTPFKDTIALETNTETFSDCQILKKYGKKPESKYVFDDETGEFRRKLNDDYGKNCRFFDKGAISRKGSRNKFLDFSSNDNFLKSKAGIIATFFSDVKTNLSDFITISQIPLIKYNSLDNSQDAYENKDYKTVLQNRGICVVDTVDTEQSKQMKNRICDFLKEEYEMSEISDRRESGKYIIEIIHDKDSDFYASKEELTSPSLFKEMNKAKDQHNIFTEKDIIQHITVENSAEKIDSETIKNVMHNIIQELIIKGDLHDRQISIVNWKEPKEWTFVRCGRGKWNSQKRRYEHIYYKMTISKSGKISFDIFDNKNYPDKDDWTCIDNIFSFYNKDCKKQYSDIECIVYDNINNINIIYKTKQVTLPNIEELSKRIKLSDINKKISKSFILNCLQEFSQLNERDEKETKILHEFKNHISEKICEQISYKEILKYDEAGKQKSFIKRKIIKEFVDWLEFSKFDENGEPILLHPQLKSGNNLQKNFNSFLGIKSTELNGTFKYFVGKKDTALQTSLPNSCVIRDVIPWNQDGKNPTGNIFFEKIAHMLTVEFVRNGQYTVVPFPIKYLNEYIRFCEKDEDFENE